MRHLKVTFRPEAVKDISTIFHYIHELSGSAAIARGFVQRIRDRCIRIGNIPHGGRPRDDLAEGLRIVPFERSTVIAYTVTDKTVQITNIFYGGRNYEALYRSAPPEEELG